MAMSEQLLEATDMVESLRVIELQSLLSIMGENKYGLKKDLVKRATKFLHQEFHPDLLSTITKLYNQRYYTNCAKSKCSQVLTTPTAANVRADSSKKLNARPNRSHPTPEGQMIKLPFYHILETIVAPVPLVPKSAIALQTNYFTFCLTSAQSAQIESSLETKDGLKSVQVVLRSCYTESIGIEDDQYPPGIVVSVNGIKCHVQARYSSFKKGLEPSRPCCPINLTPYLNRYIDNNVYITWEDIDKHYSAAVQLVRVLSSAELLEQLQKKSAGHVMLGKQKFSGKLGFNPENEISTTGLQVSLICPLSKMRMTVPCLALTCAHLQCFDAATYLQMNERKPSWICPICHKPALFETLQIDSLLSVLLKSTEEAVKEIKYLCNGSWQAVENGTSDSPPRHFKNKPLMHDVVDLTACSSDNDADDDLADAAETEKIVLTDVKTRRVCFFKSTMHLT